MFRPTAIRGALKKHQHFENNLLLAVDLLSFGLAIKEGTQNMSSQRKGLLVDIYRPADGRDSSNNGISSQRTRAILIGEGIPEVFGPGIDREPVFVLVRREIPRAIGTTEPYFHVEPLVEPGECHPWFMAGGNFVYSCDSRFRDICGYPIPIHDRVE